MQIQELLSKQYTNLEKIGSGAMGEVWRGIDRALERSVAIKLMRPDFASNPEHLTRFRTEAKALAKINHPNIVGVYGLAEEGEHTWMVLEYIPGDTLEARLIQQGGALPWREAVQLTCQALRALEQAHAVGIIHRDVKPSNAIISEDGTLKLTDFGIVRLSNSTKLTKVGYVVGTPSYMSPEQCKGGEADARSDIYSLGVVLFEMVTGNLPFTGNTEYEVFRQHVDQDPPCNFPKDVPSELQSCILKALKKQSDRRFQSAKVFRETLEDLLVKKDVSAWQVAPWLGQGVLYAVAVLMLAFGLAFIFDSFYKNKADEEKRANISNNLKWDDADSIQVSTPALSVPELPELTPAPANPKMTTEYLRCIDLVQQAEDSQSKGNLIRARELANEGLQATSACDIAVELLKELDAKEKVLADRRSQEARAKAEILERKAVNARPDVAQKRTLCLALVDAGQDEMRAKNFSAAKRSAERALATDPGCPGAQSLMTASVAAKQNSSQFDIE